MHDLLIRGATVIDGSGGAPRSLDVAVRDGRISAVEARRTETAVQEIDASGRVLAPGFIDIKRQHFPRLGARARPRARGGGKSKAVAGG
jgi:N-acyl-D-aspartate/D-glutamate deacylase